ncbi:MAG: fructose-6-phosphate aldolase [Alphaproteobacteria bacterium]|nr:fructose-6-phosphate aldolase [Alphaproteobacteria bacterium]
MKFFVDTADLKEIKDLAETGLLDGVTTNPSLVAKSGVANFVELIREIASIVPGPVSAEVGATDYETMLEEAKYLAKIAKNVAVKLPLTPAGLKVCKYLSEQGTMVNVTLCFSAAQAILAAKAGATFVSPFVGRLDDIGQGGMNLISEICQIYSNYPEFKTEILVASVRSPQHVVLAATLGAHVATIPPKIIRQLFDHPLTDKGIAQFVADWAKCGQKILPGK